MNPQDIQSGLERIIKPQITQREADIKLILQSFVLARQTEAWRGLLTVMADIRVQFVEQAAFAENASNRLIARGAAQACQAIIDSMTIHLEAAMDGGVEQ